MAKLYLITGFLGAGKTTFLHQFVRLFPEKRSAVVINEFGKQGVDGALLADLDIQMKEINNGSIFCACKIEQFEDALLRLQDEALDYIFVEASGLSDPTAVGTILGQRAKFPGIEYAGAICLVDGARFMKVYQTARVCRMQLAISDMVIINKCDAASRAATQIGGPPGRIGLGMLVVVGNDHVFPSCATSPDHSSRSSGIISRSASPPSLAASPGTMRSNSNW